jgi:hypothetical protein
MGKEGFVGKRYSAFARISTGHVIARPYTYVMAFSDLKRILKQLPCGITPLPGELAHTERGMGALLRRKGLAEFADEIAAEYGFHIGGGIASCGQRLANSR